MERKSRKARLALAGILLLTSLLELFAIIVLGEVPRPTLDVIGLMSSSVMFVAALYIIIDP
jgi:hypothetical protein